jgi:hypothetical protein
VKFMVSWRVHDDKRHEALKHFSQMTSDDDRADRGDRIKLIGRWHDLQRLTGVAIFETDDAQAIARWILNWNNVLDADVTPVVDDDEAKAMGKQKFG